VEVSATHHGLCETFLLANLPEKPQNTPKRRKGKDKAESKLAAANDELLSLLLPLLPSYLARLGRGKDTTISTPQSTIAERITTLWIEQLEKTSVAEEASAEKACDALRHLVRLGSVQAEWMGAFLVKLMQPVSSPWENAAQVRLAHSLLRKLRPSTGSNEFQAHIQQYLLKYASTLASSSPLQLAATNRLTSYHGMFSLFLSISFLIISHSATFRLGDSAPDRGVGSRRSTLFSGGYAGSPPSTFRLASPMRSCSKTSKGCQCPIIRRSVGPQGRSSMRIVDSPHGREALLLRSALLSMQCPSRVHSAFA